MSDVKQRKKASKHASDSLDADSQGKNKQKKQAASGGMSGATFVLILFLTLVPALLIYRSWSAVPPPRSDRDGRFVGLGTNGQRPGQFRYPRGVAVDLNGNIVVCDRGNKRLQVFNQQGQLVHTWATPDTPTGVDAIAKMGRRISPEAIAVDPKTGHYLLVEFGGVNNPLEDITEWDPATGALLRTIKRQSSQDIEGVSVVPGPEGIAIDDVTGDIFIAEAPRARVRVFTSNLDAQSEAAVLRSIVARTPADTPGLVRAMMLRDSKQDGSRNDDAEDKEARRPLGVAVHRNASNPDDGLIALAYHNFNIVQLFSINGDFIRQYGSRIGTEEGSLHGPWGVVIHPRTHDVIISEWYNNRLSIFDGATGAFVRHVHTHDKPIQIDLLNDNEIVASHDDHRVRIYKLDYDINNATNENADAINNENAQ